MLREVKLTKRELIQYAAEKFNDNVVNEKGDLWLENVRGNRKYYSKGNCELPGLIVFIIAAGPSLEKNVEQLKRIPKNSLGLIMAIDASMSILFDNGIKPDLCMSIDADNRLWKMIHDSPNVDTSNVTLLCSCSVNKDIVANWKGPKHFFNLKSTNYSYDRQIYIASQYKRAKRNIEKGQPIDDLDYELIFDGVANEVIAGGNVTSSAVGFALENMNARKAIFVGQDLSWSEGGQFYAENKNTELGNEKIDGETFWEVIDVNGCIKNTNVSLWRFKIWHDRYAKHFPNRIVNATEGGIFGLTNDGSKMSEIEFIALKDVINKYVLIN